MPDQPVIQTTPKTRAEPDNPSAMTADAFRLELSRLQLENLKDAALRSSRAHASFLEMRKETLQQIALVSEMRMKIGAGGRRVLFPQSDLVEFATGSIARCFGSEFLRFEGRRYPRIPNGDLLLMSRVVSIEGSRHDLYRGATITTEYDLPGDAWFTSPVSRSLPPYSVLMEIALQPCGFLSAYMGTAFLLPDGDFYFRNLDGHAEILADLDLRGKTVTNQSRLVSTTVHGRTVIQKYEFNLSCSGQTFYRGESVFGYFSYETMINQTGLDGNRAARPVPAPVPGTQVRRSSPGAPRVSGAVVPQLDLLDRWSIDPQGGSSGLGVVRAQAAIQPQDWFYACHFYQDPVMPGSLGIEAMLQAMLLLSMDGRPNLQTQPVITAHLMNQPITWRYRGQVLPTNRTLSLEVQITRKETRDRITEVSGDGCLWIDGLRIYEVKGLGLTVSPA